MNTDEFNKVSAAVLLAGIAFVGAGLIGGALVKPKELKEAVIKIEMPEAAGAKTAEASAPEPPIAALLASADAARGEAGVKGQGCVACHSFNEGGKAGVGPNLYGVLGAPHGHMEGFAYSAALKGKAGPWTLDEMNEWLKKPAAYAAGTKMSYAGLADPKKRADIIMYLRSLSPNPVPLPAAPAATAASAPAATAPAPGPAGDAPIGVRMATADATVGQADTMKLGCIACHTYNEGGRAGIGPNVYGVLGGPIGGHMPGYAYSAALKAKGGTWTYEDLDKWLTKPAAFAPGTKMTFAGVADPKQRADLIAYLRTLSANPEPLPPAK
jgi:cytochrome c